MLSNRVFDLFLGGNHSMDVFGTSLDKHIDQRVRVRAKLSGGVIKRSTPQRIISRRSSYKPKGTLDVLLEEATNTVDIPEELVQELKSKISKETHTISRIMLDEGVSLLTAYKYAAEYIAVVLRDGLDFDPGEIDNDIEEVYANVVKLSVLQYLISRTSLGQRYKNKLMDELVSVFGSKDNKHYSLSNNNPDGTVGIVKKRSGVK